MAIHLRRRMHRSRPGVKAPGLSLAVRLRCDLCDRHSILQRLFADPATVMDVCDRLRGDCGREGWASGPGCFGGVAVDVVDICPWCQSPAAGVHIERRRDP